MSPINGLPAHVLHALVILVPLCALLAVVAVVQTARIIESGARAVWHDGVGTWRLGASWTT